METQHPIGSEPPHVGHGRYSLPKEFLGELDRLGTPEAKADRVLSFMQEVLETGDPHQIPLFWEARKVCQECFHGQIDPVARHSLWSRYSTLCKEAKLLKKLFDEQSQFLSEQIEKAIQSYEGELARGWSPEEEVSLPLSRATRVHGEQYSVLQHELAYLNRLATKISLLRKELLKAEIAHKQKNVLFDRVQRLGDQVFPRRKQRMKEVSDLFVGDVDGFIHATVVSTLRVKELLGVREEIKLLQGMAKHLTLSTEAFTTTRCSLSQCWENVQAAFKERKKVVAEQKAVERKNAEKVPAPPVEQRLERTEKGVARRIHQLGEAKKTHPEKEIRSILQELDTSELSRDERLKLDQEFTPLRRALEANCILSARNLSQEELLTSDIVRDHLSALDLLRADMKVALASWERLRAHSGSDMSQAIVFTDLINEEKQHIEHIDQLISTLTAHLST